MIDAAQSASAHLTTAHRALELSDQAVIVSSASGEVSFWNSASNALYGWTAEEAVGASLRNLMGGYPDHVTQRFVEKGFWEGDLTRRRRSGQEIRVRMKLARGDGDDRIEIASLVTSDHPAEERLRGIEYRYRNLFGAVAASFWELDFGALAGMLAALPQAARDDLAAYFRSDPEFVRKMMRATRVIDVNERSVELFEGSKATLLKTPLDVYWPDESVRDYANAVVAAVGGAKRFVAETRVKSLSGRVFEAIFTTSFLPETVGRGTLLIGFTDVSDRVRAVSELKSANMRYRMFLNLPSIAFCEMDCRPLYEALETLRREGVRDLPAYIDQHPEFVDFALEGTRFEHVNDAGVTLYGAKSQADLVGRSLTGIFPARSEVFRRSIERRFAGEAVFQDEILTRRLDGRIIPTLFCRVIYPGKDWDGKALAAQIDISEQVRVRSELDRTRRDLERAARISTLGELSASIVHEIGQPITALTVNSGTAERLSRMPAPDMELLGRVVGRIGRDAERMRAIVERIRAMAANEPINLVGLSIGKVIAEAHDLLRQQLAEQHASLVYALDPSLPPVRGDRIQLQQVLINLVMNSVQAMKQVSVKDRTIEITVQVETDHLVVSVTDNGPGFGPGAEEDVFRGFNSGKQGGLGIGLSICRTIIEGHGGRITAGNRVDVAGACVSFCLPVLVD